MQSTIAKYQRPNRGFTLIELVVVIVIIGIMSAIGFRTVLRIGDNRAFQLTLSKMEILKYAIAGNPAIVGEGVRIQYGYVGDTGLMPTNLNALVTDPGVDGWNGPYLEQDIIQEDPTTAFRDGWENMITYTLPGDPALPPTLTSTSNGGDPIVLNISSSIDALLNNTLALRIKNADGYPIRGTDGTLEIFYGDSWHTMDYSSSVGSYLSTVPIGAHEVRIIISDDTTYRIINVGENNSTTSPDLGLEYTVHPSYGIISYEGGSLSLGGTNNSEITFDINNNGNTTFDICEVQLRWDNSNCWECEYAYLSNFTVNTAAYWAWNTSGRTTLASNSARLLLDETLKITRGTTTIGPVGFFDLNDGTGTAQPMDDVNFTVTFYSLIANNQSISFSTGGTCTPATIVQVLAQAQGDAPSPPDEDVLITLQNNGDAQVTLTGITILSDTTDIYLDQISFGTAGDTYWKAYQTWCNNNEGRKEMSAVSGVEITFCTIQPPAVIPGNDSKNLYLLNFFNDPLETSSTYHQDMSGRWFSLTLHFACGNDQIVTASIP